MRTMTLERIDTAIDQNRSESNRIIRSAISSRVGVVGSKTRQRTRSKGERVALTKICVARWEKAVQIGKIKPLGGRTLYYDYT